jgi:hypothetical protein
MKPIMKLFLLLTIVSLVSCDDWQCNGDWKDGGLVLLSFLFKGYCEQRYGQCFLDSIRARAITVHN